MLNRLYNGEMQAKNPAGLPPRNPERLIPRDGVPEQDWWLRNNDRARVLTDGPFTYFNKSPLKKSSYQVGSLERDHSRRVFKELARQGHSFSEANLQALKQDRELRKSMQKRYWEVMGTLPGPPGPTKPMLRSSSQPSFSGGAPEKLPKIAPQRAESMPAQDDGRASELAMSRVMGSTFPRAASQVSAAAPAASRVSMASVSQLPGAPPMGVPLMESNDAAGDMQEMGSAVNQGGASGLGVSALSVSDFYAWRPRLLR